MKINSIRVLISIALFALSVLILALPSGNISSDTGVVVFCFSLLVCSLAFENKESGK